MSATPAPIAQKKSAFTEVFDSEHEKIEDVQPASLKTEGTTETLKSEGINPDTASSANKEAVQMASYPPEKAGQPGSRALTMRTTGGSVSDDDAVPDVNPTDTAGILLERLQAWKHACGDLEGYVTAMDKLQKAHAKECEKVLKTISSPLREGHHFDQSLGGVAGLFENMRANTQGIADSHMETSKALSSAVLPILLTLHQEIKKRHKELSNGAAKGSKGVANARNTTQKHIELLGQHSAAFDSSGGKIEYNNDPYVLQRGIQYRLHRQVMEENNNRNELIAAQDSFQKFEAHVVQTIQQAFSEFIKYLGAQADREKALYSDIVGTSQRIPLEFEWMNFLHRSGNYMIDPSGPQRSMSNITFPNQNHAATKALIAGTLDRKSRAMGGIGGYKSGYYVVTPSKYLHQFEDDNDFKKDPTPDLSLYLPDCTIGAVVGEKFNIKGKDTTRAFQMNYEYAFKAHTAADAQKWWTVISEVMGSSHVTNEPPSADSSPISGKQAPPLQTQNLPTGKTPASGGPWSASTPQRTALPSSTPQSAIKTSPDTTTGAVATESPAK